MEEKTQRQGGFDREVRVLPLRAPRARSVRFPGGDGRWGQPDRNVASTDQGAIIGGPVLDVVLRLVRGMDSRLHPSSLVCPLETSHRIRAPTPRGVGKVITAPSDAPRTFRRGVMRAGVDRVDIYHRKRDQQQKEEKDYGSVHNL